MKYFYRYLFIFSSAKKPQILLALIKRCIAMFEDLIGGGKTIIQLDWGNSPL
jgi:hypothetical protein